MGLVSATEMLKKAKEGHYAVGQFNINNLEWTKSVLLTAEELKAPVILGVSEGAAKYMTGYTTVAAMVKAMVEALNITVPVALHLDHGSYEGAKAALDAGFSSIMFDGSHYGIEENIEKTKEIVDLGVDFLAAGIGNIHGKYPANWEGLDFDALDAIQAETGKLPLVLHGGSGIPDEMIKKAITLGVSKVNVNTECQLYFQEATRKYIEAGKDLEGKGYDPRKLLAPGAEAIKQCVKDRMEVFGCIGKA